MKISALLLLVVFFSVNLSWAQSDNCSGAPLITPTYSACQYQAGSSANATQSLASCSGGGNADDDVWYRFVANSTFMTIKVDPTAGYDAVVQLFSGTCGALSSIQCRDVNGINGVETITASGLTVGQTYYFRVYHYGVGSGTSTFNVCVFGLAPPTNNLPCNGYLLPAVTPSCNYLTFTNLGSAGSSVPTPTGCGGSAPQQGGYFGGDVWFKVIVPSSGRLDIHALQVDFTDGAMALYNGPCASPTLVQCDDDGPPADGILMPYIYRTGLTPGDTMYIRFWEYGNNANGRFSICVSTPDNDNCPNAQQICDLNGYGGVTSSAYTIDQPSNMCGIGNPASPIPGCVFGTGYTGTSPVQIDNNSWLRFTASGTTAQLFVEISSCNKGLGMQMQIFGGVNCTNFVPVSNFLETNTSQTITATGLTPGNTYYIVIDGFAGDVCSYTISATSGVQVVQAVPAETQLCAGNNVTISAQVTGTGSYTYSWQSNPPGFTSNAPSINVSPTANTQYTVFISGLCGQTTSASSYITVNPLPVANAGNDITICSGQSTTLTAVGGATYSWDQGLGFGASKTVSPTSTTTYTVTVTDANGCVATDQVTVNVNPLPLANAGNDVTICAGQTATLTATGGSSYSWNMGLGSGASKVVAPSTTTTYTVTVSGSNGCVATDQVIVNVNPLPNVSAGSDVTICNGASLTLAASGASTYVWDNGLGAGQSHTVTPAASTTYQVTGTSAAGCSNTAAVTVNVGAALVPDAGPNVQVCQGNSITLNGTGGINYTWTDALGGGVGSTQTVTIASPVTGYYYLTVTDGLSCSGQDSVLVTVNLLPTANAGAPQTICIGETVLLSATGGTSYVWNQGLGAGQSHTISPTSNISYTVTVTNANGCSSTANTSVTVNPLPTLTVSASQSAVCAGASAIITASGANSYVWSGGLSGAASHSIVPTASTTYYVTGTNTFGCISEDSVTVIVNALPVPDAVSTLNESCLYPGTAGVPSVAGAQPITFVWTDATGNVVGNTAGIGNLTAGMYNVLITDANGCTATSSANIGFANLSNVSALNDTTITNPAIPVSVNAVANDTGNVATVTVLSGPFNGTGSFNANGIYTYTSNQNFVGIDSVIYRICDPVCVNDCRTAVIYIVVDDRLPVDVPTGFSPNGDGFNDFFVISNLEQYPNNELFIYNRWGGLIFTAAPYNNDWDGTSMASATIRGDKVVDGTYFVILKLGPDYPAYQGYLEIRTQ